jgi:hypothetical protein
MKPFSLLVLTLLSLYLASCKKDKKEGSLGGNSTLNFYPTWEDGTNGIVVKPAYGATVCIWFDGYNSDNLFESRNPNTADHTVVSDSNDAFVNVTGLKPGNYGWRIFAQSAGMWKMFRAQGSTEISKKEKNKTIKIDTPLH